MWSTPVVGPTTLWQPQDPTAQQNLSDGGVGPTLFGLDLYGVLLTLLAVFVLTAIAHWWMWMFGLGRFKPGRGDAGANNFSIGKPLVELLVKIIDDFRHLLALVILGIFLITLLLMLGAAWNDAANMKEALEVVVASLGGLVGSIVGYYFGESAARRAGQAAGSGGGSAPTAEQPGGPDEPKGGDKPAPKDAPRPTPPPRRAAAPPGLPDTE